MVSGGPYGIEDILGGAGYGKSLLILALVPLVWTLPTTLMIGELASAIPTEGGFYRWVRRALGPFWGYQEAWLSLTASIFDMAIYPTIFVLYLGRLFPAWTAGHRALGWEVVLVAGCCLWNLRGAPAVGEGSIALFLFLLAPFVLLSAAGFLHGWGLPATARFPAGHAPDGLSTAILVAMWNYMGWDNASTIAQEVEDPRRNYPRAMLATGALVALTYIVPLCALAFAGMPADRFSTGSWTDAAHSLVGPLLAGWIVLGGTINGVGMFNALMLSYTRLPMVMAEDGLLPGWLARRNRRGVPWTAVAVCGAAWALALRFSFERLISIDLVLYGTSLMLEFVALAVLRFREPELARPFRATRHRWTACLLGVAPACLILYAMYSARTERMAGMPSLLFGGLVIAAGPVLYWLSRRAFRLQRAGESFAVHSREA